jgi:glycosyltransferase involved in cell wall biosynthesis
VLLLPPPAPLRVAWFSSWMVACGVGEHSRLLLDHFIGNPAFAAEGPLVLCDLRPRNALRSPAAALRALPCWELGRPAESMERIASAIAAEEADVVVIQHQPMLLGWPHIAMLLRHRVMAGRVVVVTFHNTSNLEEYPPDVVADVVDALRLADRLIVHSPSDIARLQRLGLLDRVTLLPTGGWESRPARPPRLLPRNAAPVLGCFGFFLPHKGVSRLLRAAALLRADWPGLRVRLVNARYPAPVSDQEIAACRVLVDELGLGDAVEWHTEYLPTEQVLDLLGGCDLLVLPYEPSTESASSAVRMSMASGVAVAVTPVAIFDDQGDALARLPGETPDDIASGVAALLRDPARRIAVQGRAADYLRSVSWATMSRRLQGMIQGLSETRRAGGA